LGSAAPVVAFGVLVATALSQALAWRGPSVVLGVLSTVAFAAALATLLALVLVADRRAAVVGALGIDPRWQRWWPEFEDAFWAHVDAQREASDWWERGGPEGI